MGPSAAGVGTVGVINKVSPDIRVHPSAFPSSLCFPAGPARCGRITETAPICSDRHPGTGRGMGDGARRGHRLRLGRQSWNFGPLGLAQAARLSTLNPHPSTFSQTTRLDAGRYGSQQRLPLRWQCRMRPRCDGAIFSLNCLPQRVEYQRENGFAVNRRVRHENN